MEDEELVPENSDLKRYLEDVGFHDFETVASGTRKEAALNLTTKNNGRKQTEFIDADVIEQIQILLSAKLIFDDDITNIENLLLNFKTAKRSVWINMFSGTAASITMFLGLFFYFIVGGYVFIVISTFYAYRTTDYLWKKHFNHNKLKNLVSILESNYVLLKKTLNFIQENESILKMCVERDAMKEVEYFAKLKHEFVKCENKIVKLLTRGTHKLIRAFPLYENIEQSSYYLCNQYDDFFIQSIDVTKLHELYSLIQSEFLQRVVLTLVPNLQLSNRNNLKNFHKVLYEITYESMKLGDQLSKKFKFVFINGVYNTGKGVEAKISLRNVKSQNYASDFVSSIHDTSNTLQTLLIKAREMENSMDLKNISPDLESELTVIQNDLLSCQNNISDSIILLKKLNSVSDRTDLKLEEESEIGKIEKEENRISVGYTDLDPKVEDEIFEAFIVKETCQEKDIEGFDFEDNMKRRQEKEYSKNVLRELKTKLVGKAKDWEEREKKILGKSDEGFGLLPTSPGGQWPLSHFNRCHIKRRNGRIVPVTQYLEPERREVLPGSTLSNVLHARVNLGIAASDILREETFGESSDDES